jgi:hypothetical protein
MFEETPMNIEAITDSARSVIHLLHDYSGGHVGRREQLLDPILYGYLQGRFSRVARQYWVRIHGRPRPQRIDFRCGGNNPIVIEFAVRPPHGGPMLYGSQNRSELRKLCRVTRTSARLRVLLLIDLAYDPIHQDNLQQTYDDQSSGPGNFTRHSVRVVYVHLESSYNFLWQPN